MSTPILSNGVRQNLLSLQQTTRAAGQAQLRLATGKKVNSALDNPVNFFTSAGLKSRSDQLAGLLDGISNGIQTITAASSGIESIVKLVQSAQATIRQALNDAAQNRPSRVGSTSLASSAETAAANKSALDVVLDKKIEEASAGAGAVAATAATSGNLGIATGSTVTISAGSTTYSFTTTPASTVRDLLNEINKSGVATAAVDASGRFSITGAGSDALRFNVQGAAAGDGVDNLGFSGADVTSLGSGVTATANSAIRSGLIDQFNTLRTQIDRLATDAGYNGTNLLQGNALKVIFNEKTGASRNALDVQGFSISAAALGIQSAVNGTVAGSINFQNDIDLTNADQALTNALTALRSQASTLGANLSIVQVRQDFTQNLITTLKTGADNLVLADTNEEGANLLALQTRQQLSQTALSLASQADQAVLRLFS